AFCLIFDRQPIDEVTFRGTRTAPYITPAVGTELCCVEALSQERAHRVVSECLHAAIRVMDHEPLVGAEQLMGDNKRADGIIAGPTTSIADHVRIALCQASKLSWVKPCIHAGQDGKMPSGRHGETALVTEPFGIAFICRQDIITNLGHENRSSNLTADAEHQSGFSR